MIDLKTKLIDFQFRKNILQLKKSKTLNCKVKKKMEVIEKRQTRASTSKQAQVVESAKKTGLSTKNKAKSLKKVKVLKASDLKDISSDFSELSDDDDAECSIETDESLRKCSCGYNPYQKNDNKTTEDKCAMTRAFFNHITYPSFKMLLDVSNKSQTRPTKQWALFVEIKKVEGEAKSEFKVIGKTRFHEEVEVNFINDKDANPTTFQWSDLKKGYVLAILYAEAKDDAVEVGNLDNCYVFKSCMINLLDEAFSVLDEADMVQRKQSPICRLCNIGIGSSFHEHTKENTCKQCKMAKYCSKVSSRKIWLKMYQSK